MQFSSRREALNGNFAKESAVTCNTSTKTSDICWHLLKKSPRNSLELSQQNPVCLVQNTQKDNYVNSKIILPHYITAQAGTV